MADRKVTVLNSAGYQEQLPDTDNIVLTLAPTADNHGANKAYVDSRDSVLQGQIDQITGGSLDGKYVERAGDTMTGDLTINDANLSAKNVYIPQDGLLWGNASDISREGFAIGGNGVAFIYYDRGDTGTANECIWFNNAAGGIRLGTAANQVSNPKVDISTSGTAKFVTSVEVADAKLSLTSGANEYHIGTHPFRISSDAGLNLFKVHDSSGNVAIGGDVAVPGDKLQVYGYATVTGTATASGLNVEGPTKFGKIGESLDNSLTWYPNTAGDGVYWMSNRSGAFAIGNGTTQGNNETLRITSGGNVGIGIDNPVRKLQIQDSPVRGSDSNTLFVLEKNGSCGMQILAANDSTSRIFFGDQDNGVIGRITYAHANDSMQFMTSGTTQMTIGNTGNVNVEGEMRADSLVGDIDCGTY